MSRAASPAVLSLGSINADFQVRIDGHDMRQSVLLAVATTELAVAAYGAQPSYPDRARVEAHLLRGG